MAITTNSTEPKIYQLMVTLLERKTLILRYETPSVVAGVVKRSLYDITRIPTNLQRLVTGTRQLWDDSVISCDGGHFPTVSLTLPLRGGKGGFGSLLRGAGSKAWQKKTSNFDACRDMSGRRLRHVNAEKKLEEWKAAEGERRLEKKAEEFLKKMAKKGKKGVGDGEAEKYVAKYREQSERCVSEVLDSVKEAVAGKRKSGPSSSASEAKRLKIWMGKRKLAESSDDDDSDDEQENEKSTVLNNGNHSDSSKDADGSSDSVTGGKQDGEFPGGSYSESDSEEEKENVVLGKEESGELPIEDSLSDGQNDASEPLTHNEMTAQLSTVPSSDEVVRDEKMNCNETVVENVSTSSRRDVVESKLLVSESRPLESGPEVHEEAGSSRNVAETETPLNFDQFNLAVELEVLGLERLKSELQARGLKCGGTLQERAARLYLLKSTPLEKLPKKLLAKK